MEIKFGYKASIKQTVWEALIEIFVVIQINMEY